MKLPVQPNKKTGYFWPGVPKPLNGRLSIPRGKRNKNDVKSLYLLCSDPYLPIETDFNDLL